MSEHKLLFFVKKDEISHPLEIAKKVDQFFSSWMAGWSITLKVCVLLLWFQAFTIICNSRLIKIHIKSKLRAQSRIHQRLLHERLKDHLKVWVLTWFEVKFAIISKWDWSRSTPKASSWLLNHIWKFVYIYNDWKLGYCQPSSLIKNQPESFFTELCL